LKRGGRRVKLERKERGGLSVSDQSASSLGSLVEVGF
jgi:hypothetical protein